METISKVVQNFFNYHLNTKLIASLGKLKEISLVSIGVSHTRKSLVKGERFIRYEWKT